MPAPSPDAAGRPAPESVFSASGDLATEVTRIADGDSRNFEALHTLDPDQVEGARAKKRLGLFFWIAAGFFILIVVSAITAPWLPIKDPAKIVGRPRLLLIDEALDGLEPDVLHALASVLFDRSKPWTLLIATHDMEVMQLCDLQVKLDSTKSTGTSHAGNH